MPDLKPDVYLAVAEDPEADLHAPHFAKTQLPSLDVVRSAFDGRLQKLVEVRFRAALQDHTSPATASAMIIHAPTCRISQNRCQPTLF